MKARTKATTTSISHSEAERHVLEQLQYMQSLYSESHELLNRGVRNELATSLIKSQPLLDKAETKPMQVLTVFLNEASASLRTLATGWALAFFKKKAALLQQVFLVKNTGDTVEYVLVPKVDSAETDHQLYEFLSAYKQTDFYRHAPVLFHIVPVELVNGLQAVEPVAFA